MEIQFILGLLLAIPLSILANVLTPIVVRRFQDWRSATNERSLKRLELRVMMARGARAELLEYAANAAMGAGVSFAAFAAGVIVSMTYGVLSGWGQIDRVFQVLNSDRIFGFKEFNFLIVVVFALLAFTLSLVSINITLSLLSRLVDAANLKALEYQLARLRSELLTNDLPTDKNGD